MGKPVSKIAYLDGIRGIAALLVFFHHFLLSFYIAFYFSDPATSHLHNLEIKYGQSVFSVFTNGNFFVCVFFVLSGYVLSRKYFQSQVFEVIVSAAQRRFLRLYIPVAFVMILAYVLMLSGAFFNQPAGAIAHSDWLGSLWTFPNPLQKLWYCLKAGTMFFNDATFDTSLWTIAIELTGSFFVFAFLAFTHNTRNAFFSLVLVFLYCCLARQGTIATFVFGISLNYTERFVPRLNRYFTSIAALVLLVFGLVLGSQPTTWVYTGTLYEHLPPSIMDYAGEFHPVGAYLLVLSFVISPVLQRLVSGRLFRFLGYVSFSLYLLHPLVIGSFGCFIFLKIYGHTGYNHAVAIVFLLTTTVLMGLSWLMTKYIDDPGIRFSKYVYSSWIKKTPEKATAEVPQAIGDEKL